MLLLMIPMNAYDKKLWVEVCSQVLTGKSPSPKRSYLPSTS